MNSQLPIFEDMIIAEVTDLGFEIISREVTIDAVGNLLKDARKDRLEEVLDSQTSALRLSQNLGADYLLFATLMGMDEEKRHVNARGIEYDNYKYTLRASYRVLEGNTGASLTSGMMEPSRTIQQTRHSHTTTTGIVTELLVQASKDMGAALNKTNKSGSIKEVNVAEEQVTFQVVVSLNEVNFPQAEIDADGHVTIVANKGTVEPMAVPVELDGMLVGTTGTGTMLTPLKASPGLHRIRLVRDDLEPFERMVNIYDGMQLNITMQLNDNGLKRWKEKTRLYTELMQQTKLNDAQVELIRGEAQRLRQSGYKINLKIDTDEGVTIEKNQSLLNQD
ncbi:hypothetical protein EGM51_11470 [Verrucomicrobia bacterium S94]|nr:hypothetical protein EGM51_11470 [Verrucomicrobia bacterium S94]